MNLTKQNKITEIMLNKTGQNVAPDGKNFNGMNSKNKKSKGCEKDKRI